MNKYLLTTTIAASIALTACTSTGVYVDPTQTQNFTVGESRLSDVLQKLGEPSSRTLNSEGHTIISYIYSETSVRPETFLPYVGGLVGGADTRTNTTTFTFDKNLELLSYDITGQQIGTSTGLSSGTKFQRVDQHNRETDESVTSFGSVDD